MTETPLLRWSAIVLSVTAMALGGTRFGSGMAARRRSAR